MSKERDDNEQADTPTTEEVLRRGGHTAETQDEPAPNAPEQTPPVNPGATTQGPA